MSKKFKNMFDKLQLICMFIFLPKICYMKYITVVEKYFDVNYNLSWYMDVGNQVSDTLSYVFYLS